MMKSIKFINQLIPFWNSFQNIWNINIIESQLLSIKLGSIIFAILFAFIARVIFRWIRKKFIINAIEKIPDHKNKKWLDNLYFFVTTFIILIVSLHILGVSNQVFSNIWKLKLFTIKENPVSIGNLIVGIFLLYIGLKIAKIFSQKLNEVFKSRFEMSLDTSKNVETLIKYVFIVIVVLFCMSIVGIPLTAFTVIGGTLAIGIGFGSKDIMSNFISGLVLMAEKQHKIGDVVEIENNSGMIEEIGARSTRIRTWDNVRLTIPNHKLLDTTVINWSLVDYLMRRNVKVGVAYGSPVKKVKELLYQAVTEHEDINKDPKPVVLFKEFGDSALLFEIKFWVEFNKPINMLIIESDLRTRIDELFRQEKVVIAFPQLDVHIDNEKKPLEIINKNKIQKEK